MGEPLPNGRSGSVGFAALGILPALRVGLATGFHEPLDLPQGPLQNFRIEKVQGTEGLVLLGGRNLEGGSEIGQELLNTALIQLVRAFQAMEKHIAADPVPIRSEERRVGKECRSVLAA